MCGRFTLATPADDLVETFGVGSLTFDYVPRFNIAPGQRCLVVAEDRRGRRMGRLDWGFIPSWREVPGRGFINARSESVATKPSFREAFRRRRCLVPADGFFEWQRRGGAARAEGHAADGGTVPFWVHPIVGGVVSFGGIWETWSRGGAEPRHTFAIITTRANGDLRDIHDRMPVVIAAPERAAWLDRRTPPDDVARLLRPSPVGSFASHPVDPRVNDVAQDDAGLVGPRAEAPPEL